MSKPKRLSSVLRGRLAKHSGDAAEAFWERQHDSAKSLGVLLDVQHNQPAARFIRGRLTYVKKSAADYVGVLANGKMLAAESKSVAFGRRLPRSEIKTLQADQLNAVASVAGAAYLLVEFRGESYRRFAIPWLSVPWRELRSAGSIGVGDMKAWWEARDGECYLAPGVKVPYSAGGRRRVYARE